MSDITVTVENVKKLYKLYDKPIERLKESLSFTKKKYYREHYALNDISLKIKKGENLGIIGTNGSGKSTLLKIITGVLNQTSGSVVVNGKISALLELGTGFNPEYTGIENIYLNGTMMGYSHEEINGKVQSIIEFADIGEFVNQPVKTYSSGMFARLAFAVAINVDPEILIVDETLSVGDIRFQIKCMNKMKQMMAGGTTVLFVSHDSNAIKRFCDKVLWLDKGNVKRFGDVNEVVDEYLDFLKAGEKGNIENKEQQKEAVVASLPPFIPGENIAEIVSFKLVNLKGVSVNEIELYEQVSIDIIYDVYDTNIDNPVLGVAIRGMDDDYICGLNTLLDHISIPWRYGRNHMILNYPEGILATGGKYYFNAALFDETATVPIQFATMISEFTIKTGYVGEGRYIIPHEWRGVSE